MLGEATEAWQRGTHRGRCPMCLGHSREEAVENPVCLSRDRLLQALCHRMRPFKGRWECCSCRVTCSTSLLRSGFLLVACALTLAWPPADAASGVKERHLPGATHTHSLVPGLSLTLCTPGNWTHGHAPLPGHSPSPISRLDASEQIHRQRAGSPSGPRASELPLATRGRAGGSWGPATWNTRTWGA